MPDTATPPADVRARLWEFVEQCEAQVGPELTVPADGAQQLATDLRDVLALATTPGDDRGRELAGEDLADVLRALGSAAVHVRHADAKLRALAAPAETEAGAGDTGRENVLLEYIYGRRVSSWPQEDWTAGQREIARGLLARIDAAATATAPEGKAGELPAPLGDLASWLRAAAAGRREYAEGAPENQAAVLQVQASTLDGAARLAEGDPSPMHWWLPSWRWGELWSADPVVEEIDRNRHGLPVYSGEGWTVEADPAGNVHVVVSDDSHPAAGPEYVFEPDVVAAIAAARRDPAPAPARPQAEGAGETGDQSARGRAVDLIDDVEHDCPVWVGERAVSALEAAGLRIAIRTTDGGA